MGKLQVDCEVVLALRITLAEGNQRQIFKWWWLSYSSSPASLCCKISYIKPFFLLPFQRNFSHQINDHSYKHLSKCQLSQSAVGAHEGWSWRGWNDIVAGSQKYNTKREANRILFYPHCWWSNLLYIYIIKSIKFKLNDFFLKKMTIAIYIRVWLSQKNI
jgi:hypothetical protein